MLYRITIFFVLTAAQALGALPLEDIKNLDLTNPGYEDLNPLHGLVWNEGILENHGELLPEGNALRKIILLLYHRTGTFDPSTQPDTNSVVPYLTPEVIGNINGALKQGNLVIDKIVNIPSGKEYAIPRKYRNNLGTWLNELRNDQKAYRVMLALLWSKAQSKKDIVLYYDGVRAYNQEAVKDIPQGWLDEKFGEQDAKSAQPPEIKNYDAFLYWTMKRISNAPPLEHQGTSFISESLADCGETSLKNFIKLAIDQNGIYNVGVLKALGAKQNVIDVFTKFPNRRAQTSQEARDAFSKVTINLEHVVYKQNQNGKKFEIRASTTNPAQNMLVALRALFAKLKDAQNWEQVGQRIEAARKQVGLGTFQIEMTNLSTEGHGEVTFAVQGLGRFKWYFQPWHFFVDAAREGIGRYPKKDIEDIAVFYPMETLPGGNDKWFLYARLRQNEIIDGVLLRLNQEARVTVNILVMLLNRLTTDDASQREFGNFVNSRNIAEVMAHKNFRPSEAYLTGLLYHLKFDAARQLVSHKYFAEKTLFFIGHSGTVNSAMFSHDGTKVITTSSDETARIWQAKTGELIRTEDYKVKFISERYSVGSAVFSRDGSKILTTFGDGAARIWNAETGREIHTLIGHHRQVNSSARFNEDGTRVVTAGIDETARIWNADTGKEIVTLKGHTAPVNSAVFSRDGKQVLTASDDKTARIWNAETGKQIRILNGHSDKVNSAEFSPDDLRVLTASRDNTARIWNVGKVMKTFNGDSQMISAVFDKYGDRVLTVSIDGKAQIWSSATGKVVRVFEGGYIRSAVFSPDNKQILTSNGFTARIWH